MKYIDADKLITEIERRLKDYWELSFHNVKAFNEDSNVRELKELRSFISSHHQEHPDGLDEVARIMSDECLQGLPINGEVIPALKDIIKIAVHYGSEWQKQQMLKDAVEGKLDCDDCGAWVELKKDIVSPGEAGDKVKLIILKEDESK